MAATGSCTRREPFFAAVPVSHMTGGFALGGTAVRISPALGGSDGIDEGGDPGSVEEEMRRDHGLERMPRIVR